MPTYAHSKIVVKKMVGSSKWKARCKCGLVFHDKGQAGVKTKLESHIKKGLNGG